MDLADDYDCERDSGLESPPHSKDDTPERKPEALFMAQAAKLDTPKAGDDVALDQPQYAFTVSESYDDEPDESISERLWGLTEMFPDCIVNATHAVTTKTLSGIKFAYSFSRSAMWIAASTSVILFAPVFFELEIAKIEEQKKSEQKQYLLGLRNDWTSSPGMIGPPSATPPLPR